jgi:hypothetical protein
MVLALLGHAQKNKGLLQAKLKGLGFVFFDGLDLRSHFVLLPGCIENAIASHKKSPAPNRAKQEESQQTLSNKTLSRGD